METFGCCVYARKRKFVNSESEEQEKLKVVLEFEAERCEKRKQ